MSSEFGKNIKCTIFGQSHSEAMGVVIDGLPPGEIVDENRIREFMARRAPGRTPWSTSRKEADLPRIVSGVFMGKTCGAPLTAIIENTNTRSKDYEKTKDIPRPSHADYPAHIRYNGFEDYRGGGHFSGRLTAPLCFAGALCKDILAKRDIFIGSHIAAIGGIQDQPFDPVSVTREELEFPAKMEFPVNNTNVGDTMIAKIMLAKEKQDSVGGIIEGCAIGVPPGLGDPMFDGLENALAKAVFGIPAVRGVEFGMGFEAASKLGSQHNDAYEYDGDILKTKTNRHGGIIGGISTGMPIIMRIAVKPTPSIARPQQSVNFHDRTSQELVIEGRHDPCIVPRAVPVLESVMAITILDYLMEE